MNIINNFRNNVINPISNGIRAVSNGVTRINNGVNNGVNAVSNALTAAKNSRVAQATVDAIAATPDALNTGCEAYTKMLSTPAKTCGRLGLAAVIGGASLVKTAVALSFNTVTAPIQTAKDLAQWCSGIDDIIEGADELKPIPTKEQQLGPISAEYSDTRSMEDRITKSEPSCKWGALKATTTAGYLIGNVHNLTGINLSDNNTLLNGIVTVPGQIASGINHTIKDGCVSLGQFIYSNLTDLEKMKSLVGKTMSDAGDIFSKTKYITTEVWNFGKEHNVHIHTTAAVAGIGLSYIAADQYTKAYNAQTKMQMVGHGMAAGVTAAATVVVPICLEVKGATAAVASGLWNTGLAIESGLMSVGSGMHSAYSELSTSLSDPVWRDVVSVMYRDAKDGLWNTRSAMHSAYSELSTSLNDPIAKDVFSVVYRDAKDGLGNTMNTALPYARSALHSTGNFIHDAIYTAKPYVQSAGSHIKTAAVYVYDQAQKNPEIVRELVSGVGAAAFAKVSMDQGIQAYRSYQAGNIKETMLHGLAAVTSAASALGWVTLVNSIQQQTEMDETTNIHSTKTYSTKTPEFL